MFKHSLRQELLHKRRSILFQERKIANRTIREKLLEFSEVTRAQTICIYASIAEEVDTHEIIRSLLLQGKTVVLPKIIQPDTITLHQIQSHDELQPGAFTILEPIHTTIIRKPTEVDVFIVPGVGFDDKGHRLGWGKGYYDRLLAGITAPRIGLAFSCQIVPHIPLEPYDILMTTIITEKETRII